jgi:5'-3' exonuclease
MDIPVHYLNQNKEQIYKNKSGEALPPKVAFKKTYTIEKQKYDNEQAILRAQQLQQEAEVRRLQQEQNYRETQLRLIEAENQKKQKEIDLVNAQNKQIENKHALETQKANAIFLNKFLNSSSSSSNKNSNSSTSQNSSSKSTQNNGPTYECNCCHQVSYKSSIPSTVGCSQCYGGSHNWIGVHNGPTYECSKCNQITYLNSIPSSVGCSGYMETHSWRSISR